MILGPGEWLEGAGSKPEVEEGGVDGAESHTEVLLVEGDWDVLEDSVTEALHLVLLDAYTFELHVALDVL